MFNYDVDHLKTKVISCAKVDDLYDVVLKETCFYAKGGGQPNDKGTINNLEIIKLYQENGITHHLLKEKVSNEVECILNKEFRYLNSSLHTAQHVVSRVFEKDNAMTNSFSINENHFTIELSKEYTLQQLNSKEIEINNLIKKQLPVYTRSYDEKLDRNINKDNYENLRIVCLGNINNDPCGGTHINNTSELRLIKIIKYKVTKKGTRIWVLIGDDALLKYQEILDKYEEIRKLVNVEEEKIVEFIENKLKEVKNLNKQIKKQLII